MRLGSLSSVIALGAIQCAAASTIHRPASLPVVDLGYVKQRASSFSTAGDYYNFTNIRFAQPPLGKLRFAAPQPPLPEHGIQDGGTTPKLCPQAYPPWLAELVLGSPNYTASPYETEDCLFLDVLVPQKVFDSRQQSDCGVPVMVTIYGGVNVIGDKAGENATRLFTTGIETPGSDGFIYVAMNYRLGYFGSLGGPDLIASGGNGNAGLLDQRLALQWVQENIHRFGGDPSRITLLGESGGAASIAYQLTTPFASTLPKPYHQAIMQSPGDSPALTSNDFANYLFAGWLQTLNVSTLAEARALDTKTLQAANRQLVGAWQPGEAEFTPSYDGVFVNDTAVHSLIAGKYNPATKVMTSYNENEGLIFLPAADLISNFTAAVEFYFPTASAALVKRLTTSLYPPPGAHTPYSDATGRVQQFVADFLFACNAVGVERGFHNSGYAYKFSVTNARGITGYHTQDLAYTYWNGEASSNATVAAAMQRAIVDFTLFGNPNHSGAKNIPAMPIYGAGHSILNYTSTGISVVKDTEANPRCKFWLTEYR